MESLALLASIIVISLAGLGSFLGYCTGRAVAGGDPLVIGIFLAVTAVLALVAGVMMTPGVLVIPGAAFGLVAVYGFIIR